MNPSLAFSGFLKYRFLSISGTYCRKLVYEGWISYLGMGAAYTNLSMSAPEFIIFL